MKSEKEKKEPMNSKGAAIFKKILEDQKIVREHLINGGKLTDLKDKYRFLDPLSIYHT